GFVGGAAAVVDGDEGVASCLGHDVGECVETRRPGPGVAVGGVGRPVVGIGSRAARKSGGSQASILIVLDGGGGVEDVVTDRAGDGEHAGVDGLQLVGG